MKEPVLQIVFLKSDNSPLHIYVFNPLATDFLVYCVTRVQFHYFPVEYRMSVIVTESSFNLAIDGYFIYLILFRLITLV